MKKFLILICLLPTFSLSETLLIEVPYVEIEIMEDSVDSAEEWLKQVWEEKVAIEKKRIVKREINRSRANKEPIPGPDIEIIEKYLSRSDYKKKRERNEKEMVNDVGMD